MNVQGESQDLLISSQLKSQRRERLLDVAICLFLACCLGLDFGECGVGGLTPRDQQALRATLSGEPKN
jgi:hypothetical protein